MTDDAKLTEKVQRFVRESAGLRLSAAHGLSSSDGRVSVVTRPQPRLSSCKKEAQGRWIAYRNYLGKYSAEGVDMYLMYVDESGDTGREEGSSQLFCLSGLVVHETEWRRMINVLLAHRKVLRANYGLPVRAEIHASEYMRKAVFGIEKHNRLAILRNLIDEVAKHNFLSLTHVVVDKDGKPPGYDVLQAAWGTLFQRFENTLRHGNFPGHYRDDYGMIITDATAGNKLMRLMRKMAVYNPIPSTFVGGGARNIPIVRIIEDPSGRDSAESLPVQVCDVASYFLTQYLNPNAYVRRKRAANYFTRLAPVLNVYASRTHRLGLVRL